MAACSSTTPRAARTEARAHEPPGEHDSRCVAGRQAPRDHGRWGSVGWRRLLTDDTRAGEAAQGAAPRFPAGGTTERAADRSWMPPMTPTPAG